MKSICQIDCGQWCFSPRDTLSCGQNSESGSARLRRPRRNVLLFPDAKRRLLVFSVSLSQGRVLALGGGGEPTWNGRGGEGGDSASCRSFWVKSLAFINNCSAPPPPSATESCGERLIIQPLSERVCVREATERPLAPARLTSVLLEGGDVIRGCARRGTECGTSLTSARCRGGECN